MKFVYAVTCNQTPNLRSATFFSNKEGARNKLKVLAKERQFNPGVHNWNQDDDSFSFTFGWEEVEVKFSIVELYVYDYNNNQTL